MTHTRLDISFLIKKYKLRYGESRKSFKIISNPLNLGNKHKNKIPSAQNPKINNVLLIVIVVIIHNISNL